MVFKFFKFCLTVSVLEKLKKSIFEISIIPEILNINNQRTTSAKSVNLSMIRRLVQCFLKNVPVKITFTLTVFEILLFEGRLVLGPAQRVAGSERVKILKTHCITIIIPLNTLQNKSTLLMLFLKRDIIFSFRFTFCASGRRSDEISLSAEYERAID